MSYEELNKPDLKDLAESLDLPVSGTKEELLLRIRQSEAGPEELNKPDLKDLAESMGLPVSGSKAELLLRIEQSEAGPDLNEMRVAMGDAHAIVREATIALARAEVNSEVLIRDSIIKEAREAALLARANYEQTVRDFTEARRQANVNK